MRAAGNLVARDCLVTVLLTLDFREKSMKLALASAAAVAAVAVFTAPTLANDYNEAVDGDLASVADGPTLFDVEPGTNTVTGTIGMGTTLDEDFIGFTIEPGEMLDAITVDSFNFANGNTSTGFRLYTNQGSGWFQASSGSVSPSNVGQNFLTIWDLSDVGGSAPLGPGDYGVVLAEFTAGQEYSFSIDVSGVPEPASLGLFGMAGLALVRRRR